MNLVVEQNDEPGVIGASVLVCLLDFFNLRGRRFNLRFSGRAKRRD